MGICRQGPLSLDYTRAYPLNSRSGDVTVVDFAKLSHPDATIGE
jgi:hypothetical protein